MRCFLKKYIIPEWLWKRLRHYRKWARRRESNGFWTFAKVNIKEMHIREKLDFPSRDIFLDITAVSELGRLNACRKEPETVSWLRENIRKGDVFYDIGANVGAYSFVAGALAGGKCMVYAFEPSFSTFASLSRNIFLNNFQDSVVPLYIALSDKTDVATFEYADIQPGASQHKTIHSGGSIKALSTSLKTLSYRLDDIVEQFSIPVPNLVKIDVDGGELSVLKGAVETLSRPEVRTLLVEIDERIGDSEEVLRLIVECGFSLCSKHRRGGDGVYNCIFERKP